MKKTVAVMLVFCALHVQAQLLLNEIQINNVQTLSDEDGDFPDWIEIRNQSAAPQNLAGFSLTDDLGNLNKWPLPNYTMPIGSRLLVFASGKDRSPEWLGIDHFESLVQTAQTWNYQIPTNEPLGWLNDGLNNAAWPQGTGGIGYGDFDDGTEVTGPVSAVYSRTTFQLTNPSAVVSIRLLADYDDGFVAYLNGVEIARSNVADLNPTYTTMASADHEATVYQGLPAEVFEIDPALFAAALVSGVNVLAIRNYNFTPTSSDLTCNMQLIAGMSNASIQTVLTTITEMPPLLFPHANFGISSSEMVALTLNGSVIDQWDYQSTQPDDSWQRSETSGTWCLSVNPTPAAENSSACFNGYAPPPTFLTTAGFYQGSVSVALTAINPSYTIRYTLDGSIPNETSAVYSAPIVSDTSLIVAARCFHSSMQPSLVKKNSYMVNEFNVTLPVVSISTNPDNLWDPETGIYVYGPEYEPWVPYWGANFWEDWEREAYIEYFDEMHVKQMEGPVGLKIHGGWSRSLPQKSFRIQCKDIYGMDFMDYPMIPDKPYLTKFKGINLRNGGNAYWDYRFHDALMERAFRESNVDYMGYAPAAVFLNGVYFGFMEIREVLDQHYISANHGLNTDEVTAISSNYMGWNVIHGDDASFFSMHQNVLNTDPQSEGFYALIDSLIDLENYMDYIIAETYWCNGDWANGWNNTKFWHDDQPGGKWHFMLMDLDFGMGLAGAQPTDDYIYSAMSGDTYPGQLFAHIIQNPRFQDEFILRYADLINLPLQQNILTQMAYAMRDEVAIDFTRHCQRWGTDCGALGWILDSRLSWNAQRIQGARDVLQNHFNLMNQVDITLDVVPNGAGRIHISTIEPHDSLYPWTGVYYNGIPVRITAVANPGYVFHHWAPNGIFPVEAHLPQFIMNFEEAETFIAFFEGAPVDTALVVSEMMYADDPNQDGGDWIELHNRLNIPLDISGFNIKDDDLPQGYDIPLHTIIPAQGYQILARDPNAFQQQYPSFAAPMLMPFGLSSNGESIRIRDRYQQDLIEYTYTSTAPWPTESNQTGRSLELLIQDEINQPWAWVSGCIDGSPNASYDPNCGLVSVENREAMEGSSMYPNPANRYIAFQFSDQKNRDVSIYNTLGVRVMQLRNITSGNLVQIEHLPQGVYVVHAQAEDVLEHFTLVVQ
ncbi:MAG: CotH kinase family protein [Flavobacteriales bacterium]